MIKRNKNVILINMSTFYSQMASRSYSH